MEKEDAFQVTVKAINDFVGPDRLVSVLHALGGLPCLGLPNNGSTPSVSNIAFSLRKAAAVMSKHFTSRHVRDAIKTGNGPDVMEIHKTPISHLSWSTVQEQIDWKEDT